MSPRSVLTATEKTGLILVLVPYLIGKGVVSIDEAAAEFDVTPRLMREMVRTLPFVGRPGEGGYVALANDLFDIDWDLLETEDTVSITNTVALERAPRLSAREAAALLAGLQLARSLPGVGDSGVVGALMAKLARGASQRPAEMIVASGPIDEVRAQMDEALRGGRAVRFRYQAPDREPTTRTVDPVRLILSEGQWYLQGWCHLRQAMRTFHLERISELEVTALAIAHHDESVVEIGAGAAEGTPVILRVDQEVLPLLDATAQAGAEETSEGRSEVRLGLPDPRTVKRLAARHAGRVEVVSPETARNAARAWAEAALSQYLTG